MMVSRCKVLSWVEYKMMAVLSESLIIERDSEKESRYLELYGKGVVCLGLVQLLTTHKKASTIRYQARGGQ